MDDAKNGYQATPNATLEQQMMDACAPKSEREWWAFVEIGRLRAEVEVLRAERQVLNSAIVAAKSETAEFAEVAINAQNEVEALKAKNEKLWRWYNTAEQALATERGRSFKSSADRWQKVVEKLQAEVVSREAAIAEALQIVRVYAARNPLHDYNGVMQDPHGAHAWLMRNDAARAAQGDKP